MKRLSSEWVAAGMARLRERFPATSPRFAQLFVEVPDAMLEVVFTTPSRRRRLRSLFPGLSDSQIVNELIDALFAQVGAQE
jgi:hypothetical protein